MNPPEVPRQGEAPKLEDLPDELLLHIFTDIQEPKTLALLCKVDHRISRIVTPILYQRYTTPERDDDDDDEDVACLGDYHFVRALVKRPELAKHVQSLDWYYDLARLDRLDIPLQEWAHELEDEQINLISESEYLSKRNGDFEETCDSLFLATVMRTPNIKHLKLSSDNDRRSRSNLMFKARRSRLGPVRYLFPDIFRHLKSADVVLHMLRLSDLAWLMKIPSLERLQVGRVRAWQTSDWPLQPKSSNIVDFALEDCRLHWQNLAKIISTCKALTRLFYPGPESVRIVHDNDIPKLKEALDQHAGTLESLHFDVIFQHVDDYGIEMIDGPDDFGSFSHYERLRTLCIYSKFILHTEPAELVQRIPPLLHTLRLTMCWQYSVGQNNVDFMEPVSKALRSAGGHLKTMYFSEDVTGYMNCNAWQENQKICAANGLSLRVWEMRHQPNDEWEDPVPWDDSLSDVNG